MPNITINKTTPAPPKSPVLPPRMKGHRRSMTLIPVTKTSACWSTRPLARRSAPVSWSRFTVATSVSRGIWSRRCSRFTPCLSDRQQTGTGRCPPVPVCLLGRLLGFDAQHHTVLTHHAHRRARG